MKQTAPIALGGLVAIGLGTAAAQAEILATATINQALRPSRQLNRPHR